MSRAGRRWPTRAATRAATAARTSGCRTANSAAYSPLRLLQLGSVEAWRPGGTDHEWHRPQTADHEWHRPRTATQTTNCTDHELHRSRVAQTTNGSTDHGWHRPRTAQTTDGNSEYQAYIMFDIFAPISSHRNIITQTEKLMP